MTRSLSKVHSNVQFVVFCVFLCALFQLLTGCPAQQLRNDPNPAPSDPVIDQARLEFHGCGYHSVIGTVSCLPGQTISAVTEFPGVVNFISNGAGCSLNQQVQATPPSTVIPSPVLPAGTSCAVTINFLPSYPVQSSPFPIRSLFGEVVFQPDNTFPYGGNIAISTFQAVQLQFPGAVRGQYASRQFSHPVPFTGTSFTFEPLKEGTDLILVKLWDANGNVSHASYTANYYSPGAVPLTYQLDQQSDKTWMLTLPDTVSVTTVGGSSMYDLQIQLTSDFDGYVRAYTAQGRTLVLSFSKGKFKWAH